YTCEPLEAESKVKRVDFLSTVLMFDAQKETSPRSGSDGSPEGAASTLLAPAPRDQDQEEASRTLVLVSAGNGAVSPGDGQGTLGAVTPQAPDESERGTLAFMFRPAAMAASAVATAGRSSSPPLAKVERTFVHIAETTHRIVMTTGKQLPEPERQYGRDEEEEEVVEDRKDGSIGEEKGSSKEEIIWERAERQVENKEEEKEKQEIKEIEVEEESEKVEEKENEHLEKKFDLKEKKFDLKEKEGEGESVEREKDEEIEKENSSPIDEVAPERAAAPGEQQGPSFPGSEVTIEMVVREKPEEVPVEREKNHEETGPVVTDKEKEAELDLEVTSPKPHPRRRSRIPVLISEEETGSDRSSQTSPNQQVRKSRRPQLARLVLERKRSTQSTTASEDDTHQSDDSARARGADGQIKSRIPRPVTPIKKPAVQSGSGELPQTQRSVSFIQASSVSSVMQKSASAHSSIHQQKPRPQLRPSKTLPPRPLTPAPTIHKPWASGPAPSSTPRTAQRAVSRPGAPPSIRSVSSTPRTNSTSRTESPSPQRFRHAETRPLSTTPPKSKVLDSTHKKGKAYPAVGQKGKRESCDPKMKFENVLAEADGFGCYQIALFILLIVPRITLPCHFLLNNFIAATPSHHCNISSLDTHGVFETLTQEEQLTVSVPKQEDGTFTSCHMFSQTHFYLLTNSSNATEIPVVPCQSGWVYDTSEFKSTLASQFDLVCNAKGLTKASATVFFIGVMFGAVFFGVLCDKYGRKTILLVSYISAIVFSIASAVSTSFIMFAAFRFLTGISLSGISIVAIVLTIEWVDIEHRTVIGVFGSVVWTAGNSLLAGIAYVITDWRILILTVSSPLVISVATWWLIPESARWLIVNGKTGQAYKYLQKCASVNRRPEFTSTIKPQTLCEVVIGDKQRRNYTYLDLIKTPRLRKLTICTGIVWYGVASTYYGISLNITGFGLDIYLTHFIYAIIELPAKIIIFFTLKKFGRRANQVGTQVLTGVCIIINIITPKEYQTIRTIIAVLGKGLSEASFATLFLYTTELYPTVLRQNGVGYSSFMGRLGASISPLIMLLDDVWLHFPQVVFGVMAILSGLVALLLPETNNAQLPETIEDIERT
ncbi:solute carrier family 22 member 7-like, partial [Clarias magur]